MSTLVFLLIGFSVLSVLTVTKIVINRRKKRLEAKEYEQRRRAELEAHEHNLNEIENKLAKQEQGLMDREGELKKEAEALDQEREHIAIIRGELSTEKEKFAEERTIFDAKVRELLTKEKQLQDIMVIRVRLANMQIA